jgi:kynurenine formamidase
MNKHPRPSFDCRHITGLAWLLALLIVRGGPLLAQSDSKLSQADVEAMLAEVSNWGRWGEDDELGALNLITPSKRREAATLVRDGVSVSLARNVEKQAAVDNPDPFQHEMLATGYGQGQWAVDNYSVSYHGYAHTHMDSLCHLFHNGKMYNGFVRTEIGPAGAKKLSIHNVKTGIFTRGILLDVARLRGTDYLEPGTAIFTEDLDACLNRAQLEVRPGDVVFIRTGRWARRDKLGPWAAETEGAAGLHASCARWLRQRDVAMIGSDAASDVLPSGIPGMTHPVHLLVLHAMGVHILDNCDLEELGRYCAENKRWEFLLTAAPLAVEGGTGSPLNPIATF